MPDRRTREVRLIPVITGADWTRSRLAFARHLALAYFAPRVFRTGLPQPQAQVPTYTPRPAPRFPAFVRSVHSACSTAYMDSAQWASSPFVTG
jgi:hypothetical protein